MEVEGDSLMIIVGIKAIKEISKFSYTRYERVFVRLRRFEQREGMNRVEISKNRNFRRDGRIFEEEALIMYF